MRPDATTAETFADWQAAAIAGYVAGDLRIEAAEGIVEGAASDIAPLAHGGLTPDLLQTFLVMLDANALRWRWRYGATIFS